MENSAVMQNLLERLAPIGKELTSGRIWRFSERMADVYLQQMKRFDEDEEARQWHKMYSAENMPPLEWQSKQDHFNPYPFSSPSITMIDIGAGVGTASLAFIAKRQSGSG